MFCQYSQHFHYLLMIIYVSQFELISIQEWDSTRFRTYLQELAQLCKSGSSADVLLCFDSNSLESSHCEAAEEAGVQSHVCVMLELDSTEGDADWGVRLVDPAPNRRRVWTCRGETLMTAMQVEVTLFPGQQAVSDSFFGLMQAGTMCNGSVTQGPPAEACCGIWVLRTDGQACPVSQPFSYLRVQH
jgi:hypothetical protein